MHFIPTTSEEENELLKGAGVKAFSDLIKTIPKKFRFPENVGLQIPANTYVDKTLFTKNAARLTLQDGREITINSADKFSYNVGGNVTDGTKGTDLTFTEFAATFGIDDDLNSSGAQTGIFADLYII